MRLAVLCSPDSWYYRDLRRAAARHEVIALPFFSLAGKLAIPNAARNRASGVETAGASLDDFDAVLIRTMPPGSLEQVVFRMDALARLEASGTLVLNPPRSIEIAVDKYLASSRLVAAGLPHPPTIVCQTAEEGMKAFAALGGDVVVKPLFGSEGRGITRVTDEAIALRVFKTLAQLGAVLYLQKFIPHPGHDYRVLLIGDRILGMKRVNQLDWRTNVSRGAKAEPLELSPHMIDLARQATAAAGTIMAGVDLLPSNTGDLYVLEVNAVPGWQAISRLNKVDVAQWVLEEISTRLNG